MSQQEVKYHKLNSLPAVPEKGAVYFIPNGNGDDVDMYIVNKNGTAFLFVGRINTTSATVTSIALANLSALVASNSANATSIKNFLSATKNPTITIQDEGVLVLSGPTEIDFQGNAVSTYVSAGKVIVAISATGGAGSGSVTSANFVSLGNVVSNAVSAISTKNQTITIQNESSTTQSDPQIIDFQGAGVDVQLSAGKIEVIITGGGSQTENFNWRFDPSTTAADPGVGDFRLDNATLSSVTNIYVDDVCDSTGFDISNIFNTIQGNFAIYIQQNNDATKFVQFTATAPFIDNTGWFTIPVTYIQSGSGGLFDTNAKCTWYIVNQNGVADTASILNRISALSAIVSAEISARIQGDSALQSGINVVSNRVSVVSGLISEETSARVDADSALSVRINTVSNAVSVLSTVVSNAISAISTKNQIITIQDEGSTTQTDPGTINFKGSGVSIHVSAGNLIVNIPDANLSLTSAEVFDAISNEASIRSNADSALQSGINVVSNAVSVLSVQLSLQISAISQAHSALSNQNSIEHAALSVRIDAQSQAISVISQQVSALSQAHSALSQANSAAHISIMSAISVNSAQMTSADNAISNAVSIVSAAQAVTSAAVTSVNNRISNISADVTSIRSVVSSLSTRLSDLTSVVSALSQANSAAHVSIMSAISVNSAQMTSADNAISNAVSVLSTQLSLQVSALSQVISALSQANSAAHVSIMSAISVNSAQMTSADNAISNAVSVLSVQLSLQVSALSQVISALSNANSAAHASIMAAVSTKNPTLMILSNDVSLLSSPTALNFTGAGVQVSVSGTKAVISIGAATGSLTSAEVFDAISALSVQLSLQISAISQAHSALSNQNSADHVSLAQAISVVSNAVSIVSAAQAVTSAEVTSVRSVLGSVQSALSHLTSVVSALSQANSAAHASIMAAVSTKNPTLMILSNDVSLLSSPTALNFTGTGVQVSVSGTKAVINITAGGGGSVTSAEVNRVLSLQNVDSVDVSAGAPVYAFTSAFTFKRAEYSGTESRFVVGLVIDAVIAISAIGNVQTEGIISLTSAQWDDRTGNTGGLVIGQEYYLVSIGNLSTDPGSDFGRIIGIALDANRLLLQFEDNNISAIIFLGDDIVSTRLVVSAISTRLSNLTSVVSALSQANSAAHVSIMSAISVNSAQMTSADNAISNAVSIVSAAQAVTSAAVTSVNDRVSAISTDVTSIRSVVSSLSTRLSDLTSVVSALSQANSAAHVSIMSAISVNSAQMTSADNAISNAVSIVSVAAASKNNIIMILSAGVSLLSNPTALDFTGAGVQVSVSGNKATISIGGGGGGSVTSAEVFDAISVVSNAVSIVSAAQAVTSAEVTSVKSVLGSVQSALSHLTSVVSALSQANSAAHVSIMSAISVNSAQMTSADNAISNAVSIVSAAQAVTSAEVTSVKSVLGSVQSALSHLTSVVSALSQSLSVLSNTNSANHASIMAAVSTKNPTIMIMSAGTSLLSSPVFLDFTGAGVQISVSGSKATISITAGGTGSVTSAEVVQGDSAVSAAAASGIDTVSNAVSGALVRIGGILNTQVHIVSDTQSTTASTMVDISGLVLTVDAGETWRVEGYILMSTSAAGAGMKMGYSVPPLSLPRYTRIMIGSAAVQSAAVGGAAGQLQVSGTSVIMSVTGGFVAGAPHPIKFDAVFNVASAGTFRVKACGIASTAASPLHILPGSYMICFRIK